MRELSEYYTLEEARQMYEALYVKRHNEWLANERAMQEARKGGNG